jgi:hypothetical protein
LTKHSSFGAESPGTALNHALALASAGAVVFPCLPNKAPATRNGFRDATRDPDQIRRWFDGSDRLIGIATGEASGISVLDVDSGKHQEAAEWWSYASTDLPETFTYRTRSGGLHVWFRHEPGLKCSASQVATGIDVRGDGGYVIGWAAHGFPVLSDAALADWPAWLTPQPKPAPAPRCEAPNARPAAEITKGLMGLVRIAATAHEGNRNSALFWSACRTAEMVARGEVAPAFARAVLIEAAGRTGLARAEAERTIQSAFDCEVARA